MKTIFTCLKFRNPLLLIGILLISFGSHAQTKYVVGVTNNVFTPDELKINVGDTVEWKNTQGFHNVNGSVGIFPNNPESFGNSTGSDWVYRFVFTKAGTYDYQCDPHVGVGMFGKIEVEAVATGIEERLAVIGRIYPNPAKSKVTIDFSETTGGDPIVSILDITGKTRELEYIRRANGIEFDIRSLSQGLYFVQIVTNNYRETHKLLKQ